MKYFFILNLLLLFGCKSFKDKKISNVDFKCDPHLTEEEKTRASMLKYADPQVHLINDSLKKIDFKKQDFELRILTESSGMSIYGNEVFILRHFIKNNEWQAVLYTHSKNGEPKTIDEFFMNGELKQYKSDEWKQFWEKLVSFNILTITPPTKDDIYKKTGEIARVFDDTYYTVVLLNKNCSRSYTFSEGISSSYRNLPEFESLNNILSLFNSKTQH